MKLLTFDHFLNESNDIKFDFITDPTDIDRKIISVLFDNESIGKLSFLILNDAYQYEFSDDFSEDDFYDIFPDDTTTIIKIEHIEIDDEFKNLGIASQLMEYSIEWMKKKGYSQFYLNASPMGFSGLRLKTLVKFYEKFGFKSILNQGNNVQMALTK